MLFELMEAQDKKQHISIAIILLTSRVQIQYSSTHQRWYQVFVKWGA